MPRYVVRYGAMRLLGIFSASAGHDYRRWQQVIVRTERGLEEGDILCDADEATVKLLKDPTEGQILRGMTGEDLNEVKRIREQAHREIEICQSYVDRLGLQMKLVDTEHIFGGERIVIYYLAESRVDFRELVRLLAGEFQTRIEMRQIGVRDEAKLLADYGDCGQPVCCNTHLVQMPPVSMRMAKLQKATLDPTKISGRCGRLKCCLRYEYESYEPAQREAQTSAAGESATTGEVDAPENAVPSETLASAPDAKTLAAGPNVSAIGLPAVENRRATKQDDEGPLRSAAAAAAEAPDEGGVTLPSVPTTSSAIAADPPPNQ